MSKFQGYAQENRGFDPINVPDTSRRILEQAEETVRGLQAVRDANIANQAAYLNSFVKKMESERDSFDEQTRLMNLNEETRKNNAQIRLEEQEARRKAAGENREAIYKSLAGLAKSAASAYVGYKKQKYDDDYNEMLVKLYHQGITDRKDAENFLADTYTGSNLYSQSVSVLSGAAAAEAGGADPIDVAEMRQNTHGLNVAQKQAVLDFSAQRWGVTLQGAFANDNQTKVKLHGPNGTFIDGTPSQAVSSRDKALVASQLVTGFLKQNGMYGMKAEMLAPALQKMRQQSDSIVSAAIQNEITLQRNEKIDILENSVFQSKAEPSAALRFHKALAGLQFLVPGGRREARERLFKLMETPQQFVNGVSVGFSDEEITQIANSSLPSMPNKTLAELYPAEFLALNQQRAQRVYNRYAAETRAEKMAVALNLKQLEDTMLNDVLEGDNQIDLSDENIDFQIAEYQKLGPDYNEHIQTLERFRQFTPEAVAEKPYIEQAENLMKYGMLTAEAAMKLPISYDSRLKLAQKAKQTSKLAPSTDQVGKAEDHIKAYLRDRSKIHGGKATSRSFHVMTQHALNTFTSDFMRMRESGRDESQAYTDALGKFNEEFNKKQEGIYAIADDPTSAGFRSGEFKNFQAYEAKTSQFEAIESRISTALSKDPTAVTTQLVDLEPLKKVAQQLNTGQKPTLIPQVEMIRKRARKPDGSPYSYSEILFRQMEAHDLKIPQYVAAAVDIENVIPPRYSFLRNYPSPTNSDIMMMSAGVEPVYTKAPQSHTVALMQAATELGVDPVDLATIIGFESAGSYSPDRMGGEGGVYRGLIQFSPGNQKTYGVTPGMSFEDQLLGPVVQYFKDRFAGVGMSTQGATLLQLYTTVLAGNPKANINARDSFGTSSKSGVARMQPHREAALRRFFNGTEANVPSQSFGDSPWQQSQNMNPKVVERLTPAN